MPLLSFLMPVKDGAAFIGEAVGSLQTQSIRDWELVVVDDHSRDETARLVSVLGESDARVRLTKNPGHGQVQAINHGYGFCRGEYLKVMDADDLLAPAFSDAFSRLRAAEASYHDALLLDAGTDDRTRLRVGGRFARLDFEDSLRRIMVSPPRWSWTLARRVADGVFPLPSGLPSPHEDVYMGLLIKRIVRVEYVPEPLYVYRQHAGQFYGGLFNYSPAAVVRRAEAMLRIIDIVGSSDLVRDAGDPVELLAPSRTYYSLMNRERLGWADILGARLDPIKKARVAVVRKMPRAAAWLSRRRAVRKAK